MESLPWVSHPPTVVPQFSDLEQWGVTREIGRWLLRPDRALLTGCRCKRHKTQRARHRDDCPARDIVLVSIAPAIELIKDRHHNGFSVLARASHAGMLFQNPTVIAIQRIDPRTWAAIAKERLECMAAWEEIMRDVPAASTQTVEEVE